MLKMALVYFDLFHSTKTDQTTPRVFPLPDDKLLNLVRIACSSEVDMKTTEILKNTVAHYRNFQQYGIVSIRFKASVPTEKNLAFGDEISVGVMFLNRKVVLHIAATATRLFLTTFLDVHESSYGQSTEHVRIVHIKCCCAMYTGYPNRIRSY